MAPDSLRVVRAAPDDVPRLAPLFDAYRQFYGKPSDPEGAAAFLTERLSRRESVAWLAVAHDPGRRLDTAAGFVQMYPSFTSVGLGRSWILNDLFVVPAFRRRGVARLLMEAAMGFARADGARNVSLLTAHTNTEAQRLYESMGWKRDEVFQRWVLYL